MKNAIIRKHLKTLLAGFLHALKAAAAFASIAAAVGLFYVTAIVTGYEAVGTFVAAILCIIGALLLFYFCGRDLIKGRYSN